MPIKIEGGKPRTILTKDDRIEIIRDDFDRLPEDAQHALLRILDDPEELDKAIRHLGSDEYIRNVVPIDEWLEEDYYMGNIGRTLYPVWKDALIELFTENYDEAIFTGGIGIGKNTVAGVALTRMVYEMSCLRDPQKTFGLEAGSEIAFVCLSLNESLAKRVVFGSIKTKILSSRYFMEQFPFKQTMKELRFPNNIWVAASSSAISSALSLNTFGGILDEVNFMPATPPRVAKIRHGGRKGGARPSHAETLYQMLLRRMKSRYAKGGRVPGILMLISSRSHTDAFTERRIAEAMTNSRIFVTSHALWEAQSAFYCDQERFSVLVGNEAVQSRIVETEEGRAEIEELIENDPAWSDCKVVPVPKSLRSEFEKNLDEALQDLAGVATISISPFIQRRGAVIECIDDSRDHPMGEEVWDPSTPVKINWDSLCCEHVTKDRRGREERFYGPRVNPSAMRHVHIDTSLNKDATGFCMSHISHSVEVVRRDGEGKKYVEQAPFVYVDFMLKIIPPPGEDIILSDIRTLLYSFVERGYRVALLTTDQYQSVEMRQYVEAQKGIETKLLSVDRTVDPYKELRATLYEGRMSYYRYGPFIREIQRVVHDKIKNKIDHLDGECFTGETRVPLLDGTFPTMAEIAEMGDVQVYSSLSNGTVVQATGRGRKTKKVSELIDVVLDSGAVVRCTPDHPWRLWDGTYKKAKELRPGIDELMSRGSWAARKVRMLIKVSLNDPVDVYDLEVDEHSNFALSAGVFVHNSKDVSDAVAGSTFSLVEEPSLPPMEMKVGISEYDAGDNDESWVVESKPGKKPPVVKNPEEEFFFPVLG